MTKAKTECRYCHKLFHSYHGRTAKFCSNKCAALSFKGKVFSKESRKRMSLAAANRLHKSFKKTRFRYRNFKTAFGNTVRYQSKLEKSFLEFCESNGIKLENGPKIQYELNDSSHMYTADFQNEQFIVEIKGEHRWYRRDLVSGEIAAKQVAAEAFAADCNKSFLFILGKKNFNAILEAAHAN